MISLSAQASDLSGTWTASSLRVSWAVGDWGEACGPRPSGGGEKGGPVVLAADGGGFRLDGLGRSYSTAQCWEQMPGLTTRNRSTSAATISATCSMPAGDPRQAKVVTSWYPRGDEIYFDETGQYQFVVSGSNCTASVRRTRLLSRVIPKDPAEISAEKPPTESSVQAKPGSLPNTAPPPLPQKSSQCQTPGRPSEVEVTPRTKLMRQGESFTFQINARDQAGCRVPVSAKWKLVAGQGASINQSGELHVEKAAPTGDLKLEVQVFEQSLTVTARVVTDSDYERLIAGGAFGTLGESVETAAIELSSTHVELDSTETSHPKNTNHKMWLLLVGGLLLLLCATVLALLKRSARLAAEKSKRKSVRQVLPESSNDSVVTEAPLRTDTVQDAATVAAPVMPPTAKAAPPSRLCPVCGKRYDDGTAFCGEDGARLMRAN